MRAIEAASSVDDDVIVDDDVNLGRDAFVLSVDVVVQVDRFPCQLAQHAFTAFTEERLRGDVIGRQAVEGHVLGTGVDALASFATDRLWFDAEADLLLSVTEYHLGDVAHLVHAFT